MPRGRPKHRSNGTLDIEIIGKDDATRLLQKVRRMGIYTRYAANVIDALRKLHEDQHAKFRVPPVTGKEPEEVGKSMMSRLNSELRDASVNQRLRFVADENVCVSEPYKW